MKKKKKVKVKKKENELLQVKLRNLFLEGRVKELEDELISREKMRSVIDITIGDPVPVDQKVRADYVGQVASLHADVLKPKLLHMVHMLHVMMEPDTNSRDQDTSVKGAIYALRELIKWGDLMTGEHTANKENAKEQQHEN